MKELYNFPRWRSEDNIDYIVRYFKKYNYNKYNKDELINKVDEICSKLGCENEKQKILKKILFVFLKEKY